MKVRIEFNANGTRAESPFDVVEMTDRICDDEEAYIKYITKNQGTSIVW